MNYPESGMASFRRELLHSGLLAPTTVDGLYHLSGEFERLVRGVADLVHRVGASDDAPVVHLPPMLPRAAFELTGYAGSFPQLIGSVNTFTGGDREHTQLRQLEETGDAWEQLLVPG